MAQHEHHEYDDFSLPYHESKLLPFRTLERETFLATVGDVRGKSVLDLACGSGYYTRLLKAAGARIAVGVDISAEMIHLAEREEARNPLGVTFVQADAKEIDIVALGGPFDVVVCTYLFNYARTVPELIDMFATVRRAVADTGRVVGLNDNPFSAPSEDDTLKPYGFVKRAPQPRAAGGYRPDGDVVTYYFDFESPSRPGLRHQFHFDNIWFSPETYSVVAQKTGFAPIQWVPLVAPPQQTEAERAYWQAWVSLPVGPLTCFALTPVALPSA